jgi:hypothetical protein
LKYYIFHTLDSKALKLACLLSKSIPTLTEPSWSIEALEIQDLWERVDFVSKNHTEDILVKYPAETCNVMPHVEGKKVFIYQDFKEHINIQMQVSPENHSTHHALKWAQRFTWATITKDILFINTKDFLKNEKKVLKQICKFFGVKYKPVEIMFNLKKAGYNNQDTPIKIGY